MILSEISRINWSLIGLQNRVDEGREFCHFFIVHYHLKWNERCHKHTCIRGVLVFKCLMVVFMTWTAIAPPFWNELKMFFIRSQTIHSSFLDLNFSFDCMVWNGLQICLYRFFNELKLWFSWVTPLFCFQNSPIFGENLTLGILCCWPNSVVLGFN